MHAFISDVPGDETMHGEIKQRLGDEVPAGLIAHLVFKIENGLRHIEVWETPEAWVRYRDEAVEPAVDAVLAAHGISDGDVGEPVWREIDMVDVSVGVPPGGRPHTLPEVTAPDGAPAEVAE